MAHVVIGVGINHDARECTDPKCTFRTGFYRINQRLVKPYEDNVEMTHVTDPGDELKRAIEGFLQGLVLLQREGE